MLYKVIICVLTFVEHFDVVELHILNSGTCLSLQRLENMTTDVMISGGKLHLENIYYGDGEAGHLVGARFFFWNFRRWAHFFRTFGNSPTLEVL